MNRDELKASLEYLQEEIETLLNDLKLRETEQKRLMYLIKLYEEKKALLEKSKDE